MELVDIGNVTFGSIMLSQECTRARAHKARRSRSYLSSSEAGPSLGKEKHRTEQHCAVATDRRSTLSTITYFHKRV